MCQRLFMLIFGVLHKHASSAHESCCAVLPALRCANALTHLHRGCLNKYSPFGSYQAEDDHNVPSRANILLMTCVDPAMENLLG